ncbi:MAG: cupin domain-containing protein [Candidatus Bathyarchaeia archaeon]
MEFKHVDEVEGEQAVKGYRRKLIFTSENIMLLYYEAEPNAEFPEHSHPNEQMGIITGGSGTFTSEGKRFPVKAGSAYFFKANDKHGLIVSGEGKCTGIDIFHPPRQDYKRK